jgi:hypothetical protein
MSLHQTRNSPAFAGINTEDGRQAKPEKTSTESEDSNHELSERMQSLYATKEALASLATDSLFGEIQINVTLNHALELASMPVRPLPDYDYESDDAIAYPITGLPEGLRAYMLVGNQPYSENGRTFRYLKMDIEVQKAEPEYLDGVMRDGPSVGLSVSYDVADPRVPTRFALMLQRRVNLSVSRKSGIDAYSGTYTQGAYYWHDFLDPMKPRSAATFGIVNGVPTDASKFPATIPLVGDLEPDPGLLNEVLGQLQANLSLLKGE